MIEVTLHNAHDILGVEKNATEAAIKKVVGYFNKRYTYRVLQTIQMKLILLYVWVEQAILGSAKTAFKFKYEI